MKKKISCQWKIHFFLYMYDSFKNRQLKFINYCQPLDSKRYSFRSRYKTWKNATSKLPHIYDLRGKNMMKRARPAFLPINFSTARHPAKWIHRRGVITSDVTRLRGREGERKHTRYIGTKSHPPRVREQKIFFSSLPSFRLHLRGCTSPVVNYQYFGAPATRSGVQDTLGSSYWNWTHSGGSRARFFSPTILPAAVANKPTDLTTVNQLTLVTMKTGRFFLGRGEQRGRGESRARAVYC